MRRIGGGEEKHCRAVETPVNVEIVDVETHEEQEDECKEDCHQLVILVAVHDSDGE